MTVTSFYHTGHWLLPINCHFLRLYSAAGRGIAVSSAIEESDLYLYVYHPTKLTAAETIDVTTLPAAIPEIWLVPSKIEMVCIRIPNHTPFMDGLPPMD